MTNAQRRERAVIRAAMAWFRDLKPLGWTVEKHVHNPRCNTTTDAAERLAVATANYIRSVDKRGANVVRRTDRREAKDG